ncbi:hypothetical protein B0I37DRAFT_355898 [Chaetomium sp. MPI-CAGE-AT-0009]|nr:hypothetical protein B0I37DRAFT_355898 [Chaetomium sp. MPI-CAGE-AT-0009]
MACKVQTVETLDEDWSKKRELEVWRRACKGTKYVARVYDASFNRTAGRVRIYTELLEGGDLYGLMLRIERYPQQKRMHPTTLYLVAVQAAWALSEIQERGILHRDIKLDNVLLTMKITPQMNLALWELPTPRMSRKKLLSVKVAELDKINELLIDHRRFKAYKVDFAREPARKREMEELAE